MPRKMDDHDDSSTPKATPSSRLQIPSKTKFAQHMDWMNLQGRSMVLSSRNGTEMRSEEDMCCGEFLTFGAASHGGGQIQARNFSNTRAMEDFLDSLNSQLCFQRLGGFTSPPFASWVPPLHKHYEEKLSALQQQHDPSLRRPFDSSVFMAATQNSAPERFASATSIPGTSLWGGAVSLP
ncbi:hypothetical protein NLJ89_g9678 [Agrocybe chaxingu]|uniref:Uncharacterized protein n=1 Tax=Agrocybe chaxingu TaxID=84603 RepID=A0A9W8JS92_9AGAR|nr:hypothetical protein NLJ89_g9678 [Agrocybe chaxingu]